MKLSPQKAINPHWCLLCALCALAMASCQGNGSAVPQNFLQLINSDKPIEKKFSAMGPYEVVFHQDSSGNKQTKLYEVWSPRTTAKMPLVVMVNGTGIAASRYAPIFRHLASWGFIVIGSEEEMSGKGNGAASCLDFMLRQNRRKGSIYYEKIDTANIGTAGHSQGGAGAINAATNFSNSARIKAIFAESCPHQELAASWILKSPYSTRNIAIPIMLTSTTSPNGGDAGKKETDGICPLVSMQKNLREIISAHNVPVVIARCKDKAHHESLWESEPYLAAWFCFWLKDDAEAGKAFFGNKAEIRENSRWQDVRIQGFTSPQK